ELWTKPQPAGIRASDAIASALDILERYAGEGAWCTSNNARCGRALLEVAGVEPARSRIRPCRRVSAGREVPGQRHARYHFIAARGALCSAFCDHSVTTRAMCERAPRLLQHTSASQAVRSDP